MLLVDDILCFQSPAFFGSSGIDRCHEELDNEGQLVNEQLRLLYMHWKPAVSPRSSSTPKRSSADRLMPSTASRDEENSRIPAP